MATSKSPQGTGQPATGQSAHAPEISLAHASSLMAPASSSASAQANAERYRAIADSSFDLICELDSEGQFVYISPSFGVSTGLDVTTLEGASFFSCVPPADRAGLITEYTAALAGTRVGRAEHRFGLGESDFHWFESALRGIGAGEERRVVVVSREITARQRHQVELETLISLAKSIHSKNDLSAIVASVWQHLSPLLPATALLIILPGADRETSLKVVGETAQGAFEQVITRAEAPDCPLWEALEHPEVWLDNAWTGGDCGFPFALRSVCSVQLRADELEPGVLFFGAAKPFVWTEEHVRLCLMAGEQAAVAARGVSLLQSARDAESRYRGLVNDVEGIVWEADAQSLQPTFVSEQVEEWLGYPARRWIEDERLWMSVVHPDDQRQVGLEIREKFKSVEPWQSEFRVLSKDGREFWLRVLVTPETRVVTRENEAGETVSETKLVRLRGLAVDITERARHLEAILKSNAILAATQEASADGICLVDPSGNVVSLNSRFAELWHIPPALVEELRDRRQLMACVLSLMRQPEEFVEKMNLLRQNPARRAATKFNCATGAYSSATRRPLWPRPAALTPPIAPSLSDAESAIAAIEARSRFGRFAR